MVLDDHHSGVLMKGTQALLPFLILSVQCEILQSLMLGVL
jgi:hypothetical protein